MEQEGTSAIDGHFALILHRIETTMPDVQFSGTGARVRMFAPQCKLSFGIVERQEKILIVDSCAPMILTFLKLACYVI